MRNDVDAVYYFATKTILGVAILFLVFSSPVFGGEIYGNIKEGKKSIGTGIKVEIKCGRNLYNAQTDRYGSYRLYLADKGKCQLTVHYQQLPLSMQIYSYEGSVRYDLVLEKQGEKYSLRRE